MAHIEAISWQPATARVHAARHLDHCCGCEGRPDLRRRCPPQGSGLSSCSPRMRLQQPGTRHCGLMLGTRTYWILSAFKNARVACIIDAVEANSHRQ